MSKNIKILFLSASPGDQERLEVDREFRRIFEVIGSSSFELLSVSNIEAEDLVNTLVRNKPDIVHFSGHGSEEEIVFENGPENSDYVKKSAFIELLGHLQKKPKIVYLNACLTAKNLEALSRHIDFVVATEEKILDHSAICFAAKFYENLVHEPIRNAFDLAASHFKITGRDSEVAMYRILARPGARDDVFLRNSQPENGRREERSGLFNIGKINAENVYLAKTITISK